MDCLERLVMPDDLYERERKRLGLYLDHDYDIIRDELRVVEIIKSKCMGNDNMYLLCVCNNYYSYKDHCEQGFNGVVSINLNKEDELTREEFTLMRDVLIGDFKIITKR